MANLFADVSSYQPDELTYIKDLGAMGVVVKATQGSADGTNYKNPKALNQTQSALKAGLQTHLYHYALYTGQQDAYNEADFFDSYAKELGFDGDCVMVVDVEDPGIAQTAVFDNTVAFLQRLRDLGWAKLAVYSMASWFLQDKLPTDDAIWVASYDVAQSGVDGATAWQFTNSYNGLPLDMSYDYTGLFTVEQF
ncbi:lyzozyme M1 [Agrilactobacillus composti DSM 18527 = JCM 14202]|nr:GH25 family lysozyme [Agrilactobacillus composti]GAF41785.1 lyzozyme M1 [Agrilactobacillus composti DSM 18527 = JCM 14202]